MHRKMPPLKGEVAQSAGGVLVAATRNAGGVLKGVHTKEVPKCNANFSLATIPA